VIYSHTSENRFVGAAMLVSPNQFYNTARGLIGKDEPLLGAIPLQEEGGLIPSPSRKADPSRFEVNPYLQP